ncbi:hypothetical protein [Chachezhania sediminis]|uniref:hypothetical protein n=1 Tax=Chachezhania sediminis TaxID=2599291 RepID=UPI00131D1804|nr:hypothetical protein [Chachezhania sediminis]
MTRLRLCLAALVAAVTLVACTADVPLQQQPKVDLGNFKLGHVIVISSKMKKGPVSRDATEEEWNAAVRKAVQDQLGRYQGDQYYNFGISVEGYALAPGGIPVIYNPKSLLILRVTVWDDARRVKLNETVHQLSVFEDTTSGSFWKGSGHARTKAQQMAGLSANAAEKIEDWLAEMHATNGWFDARPDGKAGDRPAMMGQPIPVQKTPGAVQGAIDATKAGGTAPAALPPVLPTGG